MTTRRTELAASAALMAAPAVAKAQGPPAVRFDAVVFDGRYVESRRFADVMRRAGAKAFDVAQDDIGVMWFGELGELVAKGEARVCGLTAHTDLFISQSLGRERGAKLAYEGRHDAREPGPVCHDAPCAVTAQALSASGRDWSRSLAEVMLAGGGQRTAEATLVQSQRPAGAAATLFSWVLA